MKATVIAAIGLGSNLGEPEGNVERAIGRLAEIGRVAARSRLYWTEPWGVADQPVFINAVVLLQTSLGARELLGELKRLEGELGRGDTFRWGPREIDLDILTYGDARIDETDLVVPHARLFERAFALGPLAEVDPRFREAYERLPAAERAGVRAASG